MEAPSKVIEHHLVEVVGGCIGGEQLQGSRRWHFGTIVEYVFMVFHSSHALAHALQHFDESHVLLPVHVGKNVRAYV